MDGNTAFCNSLAVGKMEYCSIERVGAYHESMGHHIMQYTGLKDKNGKEIYEGDIMAKDATHPYRYEIIYNTRRTRYLLNCINRRRQFIALTDQWAKKEVIGNIYENPELLN